MDIKLETISLTRYDDKKHGYLKNDLEKGSSSSEYIHYISDRLESSRYNDKTIYQSAFVALDRDLPVGYLFISNMINDEVFLEYAILNDFRNRGYAKKMVNETTDYLFENYNIKSIRLDIDPSNRKSIAVANSCGFFADEEDYESRNYLGRIQFVKDNYCYDPKRRK